MQILNGSNAFTEILRGNFLTKAAFLFEERIYLALGTILQYKVKVVVVLVMIIELKNMVVIQLVHYFNFQLNLLDEIVLKDLLFIDDLDRIHIL